MNNFILMIGMVLIFALLVMILIGTWVYKDAKQRGLPAGMWTLLVVMSGNFIGLILYLLIGRKQEHIICNHCGAPTSNQGNFCPVCGEKVSVGTPVIKTNKRLLFACIACIVMVFLALGLCLRFYMTADGFAFGRRSSYYTAGPSGSAKTVKERSSGDTWDVSFEKASAGYTFKKRYNASSAPKSLSVDIQADGDVQLIIMQNGVVIDEIIGEGSHRYDLSGFEVGEIEMQLVNVDTSRFSGEIVVRGGD